MLERVIVLRVLMDMGWSRKVSMRCYLNPDLTNKGDPSTGTPEAEAEAGMFWGIQCD